AELELQVVELGRPGLGQVAQEWVVLAPRELAAAERVEQSRRLGRDQQALASVDRQGRVAACAELAEPAVLGARPLAEARLARRVRFLVAGAEEARQRAVRGSGQQAAIEQERLRLVQRPERPVGGQPALERSAPLELGKAHLDHSPRTDRWYRGWRSPDAGIDRVAPCDATTLESTFCACARLTHPGVGAAAANCRCREGEGGVAQAGSRSDRGLDDRD